MYLEFENHIIVSMSTYIPALCNNSDKLMQLFFCIAWEMFTDFYLDIVWHILIKGRKLSKCNSIHCNPEWNITIYLGIMGNVIIMGRHRNTVLHRMNQAIDSFLVFLCRIKIYRV